MEYILTRTHARQKCGYLLFCGRQLDGKYFDSHTGTFIARRDTAAGRLLADCGKGMALLYAQTSRQVSSFVFLVCSIDLFILLFQIYDSSRKTPG